MIITNPQSHSASQISSPKVGEGSRACGVDDESCVSMVLRAGLAAAAAFTLCTMERRDVTLCLTRAVQTLLKTSRASYMGRQTQAQIKRLIKPSEFMPT